MTSDTPALQAKPRGNANAEQFRCFHAEVAGLLERYRATATAMASRDGTFTERDRLLVVPLTLLTQARTALLKATIALDAEQEELP